MEMSFSGRVRAGEAFWGTEGVGVSLILDWDIPFRDNSPAL